MLAPALKAAKEPPAILKFIARNMGGIVPRHLEDNQLDISGLSSDPQVLEVYKSDPFIHGKISMQLGKDILKTSDDLMKRATEMDFPICCYHSPGDKMTCFKSAKTFIELMASRDKTFCRMDGCEHERKLIYLC